MYSCSLDDQEECMFSTINYTYMYKCSQIHVHCKLGPHIKVQMIKA